MKHTYTLFLVGVAIFSSFGLVAHAKFQDVDVTHPYFHAIDYFQEEGIVEGYDVNGKRYFKPLEKVSRAAALKILLVAADKPEASGATKFPDVPSTAWFAPYVGRAVQDGVVQGFPDGRFRPEANVTRAQFMKMLANVFGAPVVPQNDGEWYEPYMQMGATYRIFDNPESNPGHNLSRGEIAEYTYRMVFVANNEFQKRYIYSGRGKASYYSVGFDGRPTASGEIFDSTKLTAAHRILPFGTQLLVSHGDKSVIVRVNDRGPYHEDRIIDLSEKAFSILTPVSRGVVEIDFEVIGHEKDIQPIVPTEIQQEIFENKETVIVPAEVQQEVESDPTAPNVTIAGTMFDGTVKSLQKDFFPNIEMRESFATVIPTGLVQQFEGRVNNNGHKKVTIFLKDLENTNNPDIFFVGDVSGRNFSFPVRFDTAGKYHMGVLLDNEKKSRVEEITVREPDRKVRFDANAPKQNWVINRTLEAEDKTTTWTWQGDRNKVTKIDFVQSGTQKTLFIENGIDELILPHDFFAQFESGKVLQVKLWSATAQGGTLQQRSDNWVLESNKEWTIMPVFPDIVVPGVVQLDGFQQFVNAEKTLKIQGTVQGVRLSDHAYLTKPNGEVQKLPLGTSGDKFGVVLDIKDIGAHVFELVTDQGEIIYNRGLYMAPVQLLPVAEWSSEKSYSATAQGVLDWTNNLRTKSRKQALVPHDTLGRFAQNYANRMANEGFISHTNPEGQDFSERIQTTKLAGGFGENLGFGSNFAITLDGLENSGSHRGNILNPDWTHMGVGVTRNNKGDYYVVQVFGKF